MIKKSLQFIPLFFIIASFLFFSVSFVDGQGSSDAIAIRVMPNSQHYTIERWYQEQGFQGSPQSLIVDGYQAIRDGRTVYVNASNVDISAEQIHTNIYLISYNQESENSTVDILGQIVSHWKFNHNISATGKCSISTITCTDNNDCPGNYVCGNEGNDWQENKCVIPDQSEDLDNTKTCLTDQDCPNNFFCTSKKSQIIRDVRRLGQITEMNNLLNQYKNDNGKFPTLNSGTYIPQMSISTWPSWQTEFLSKIRMSSGVIDPVNILGPCGGDFSLKTCWNNENQSFYDSNLQDGVDLPDNSLVYIYAADDNGVDYDLCANMESGYDVGDGGVSNNNCDFDIGYFGSADNEAPYLVDYNLEGVKSEPFRGMVRFEDPEGDSLTWDLYTISLGSSSNNFNSWSNPPILKNTDNPNQKMIFAESAGNVGEYPITLKVRDSEGNETIEQLDIVIGGKNLKIQAEDVDYFIDVDNPLDYRAYIIGDNLPNNVINLDSNLNVTYSGFGRSYSDNKDSDLSLYNDFRIAQKIDYPEVKPEQPKIVPEQPKIRPEYPEVKPEQPKIVPEQPKIVPEQPKIRPEDPPWGSVNDKNFNEGNFSTHQTNLGHGLTKTIKKIADNRYELRIHGLLGDTNGDGNINENLGLNDLEPNVINFNFSVSDTDGMSFNEKFKINVISEKPYLNMQCQEVIRVGEMYNCQIINENSNNNETLFNYTSFPDDINGDDSGLISGQALEVGEHSVGIVVENEYGVSDDILWNLKIDSYCGDGSVQTPNTEQRGGPYGDGMEECDGINSIALTPAVSSVDKQYDCTTKLDDYHEKPVSQGTCTFDGGYCGDNIVQEVNFKEAKLEECDFGEDINCCNDCRWVNNYNETDILFQGEREEIILANGAQSYIDFPQVRSFEPNSGRISIEAIPSSDDKTAIVYVTDNSGSMPNGMTGVKNALIDSIDSLRDEDAEIHVGLVSFAYEAETTDIDNVDKNYHYNNLIDDINNYDDGGGTHMDEGIDAANTMLLNYDADYKYIVLLADGDYNSGHNPTFDIDTAKNAGVKIFTITYGDADIVEDMCLWSSNDECICDNSCASNNNSYVDFYAYVSGNASSVYDQITDQIIEMPTGSVYLTLNNETFSYSLDDDIILEDKVINYNNVNCIQESATCDPDKIPISVSYDGEAVIRLYDLSLEVSEPCSN